MKELNFLDRVKCDSKLKRHYISGDNKVWMSEPFSCEGVFLGYRTLSNGVRDYDNQDGWTYTAKEHIRVAYVCFSDKANPIYVLLDDIEKV